MRGATGAQIADDQKVWLDKVLPPLTFCRGAMLES
jgi:hypothetical protein